MWPLKHAGVGWPNNDFLVFVDCRKYAPQCSACNLLIIPREDGTDSYTVECLGRSFHEDCYRCEVQNKIDTGWGSASAAWLNEWNSWCVCVYSKLQCVFPSVLKSPLSPSHRSAGWFSLQSLMSRAVTHWRGRSSVNPATWHWSKGHSNEARLRARLEQEQTKQERPWWDSEQRWNIRQNLRWWSIQLYGRFMRTTENDDMFIFLWKFIFQM